ncbi:DNA mismatch repair protein MutS [Pseudorhodobacter aquimaris]|uniref:DNA mismatch repair protein MutS n=1 Tax=Pseudorhodobacter aquimaris TaxID=687412 RepID=UPI0012EECA0B|nr:DNA mismatch repair protein MutS [Pseudorhodobacter aquimaris]
MSTENVTPMMAQYLDIKSRHRDALLFYRMGDFYEMFFEDAVNAAAALDIALTKRGKHMGEDIAMCGVPYHAAEGYLLTLIRKGFRVAIAEQMENPAEAKKRGSKSVVARDVVRLVTPGTLTEDTLLDARRHNFLAAFSEVRDESALAWCDISTGELRVMPCPATRLGPELARLSPKELLVIDGFDLDLDDGPALTQLARSSFDSAGAERKLTGLFGVASLEGFGQFDRAEVSAMGALVDYLDLTQRGNLPMLRPPLKEDPGGLVQIDTSTRRNLEITTSLSGTKDASLLAVVDRTLTAAGGRLLERRLSAPSRDLTLIRSRLDTVGFLQEQSRFRADLRDALRRCPDMDRALSRLALDRGGPRDLAAIRSGLEQAQALYKSAAGKGPELLQQVTSALTGHKDLHALLDAALVAEPPMLARDGGFIASGYDPELDEARQLRDEGRAVIAAMQAEYAQLSGISSLKIKHNNVLGYFVDVTTTHAEKMQSPPLSETFIHRQTTAGQVRFTTVRLSEMETKILNAGNLTLEIEKRHFFSLRRHILDHAAALSATARAIAEIDLNASFADLAAEEAWTAPIVDNSRAFDIRDGRHPVVERALQKQGSAQFVANDCDLSANDTAAIWLLTGPNMAGKSTFLRQNALIALLAQAGSFVPAKSAHIGLVSQLFSRVGASDDLARGRSTFMVEMVETAAILHQADDRALVILDEIGRGTATYDGLSIAWATLEYLHDKNQCRALFATHYHEMTSLADKLAGVENATVSVKEWEGDVIFLHEVKKGAADRSYGVQVAKLAGLPDAVTDRAKLVLEALEKGEREGGKQKALIDDLPLFRVTQPAPPEKPAKSSEVEKRIKEVLPDQLTPMEALSLIYELKAQLDG